ncbi:MAG TPA: flagellar hook basal-body protein [Planctomycetaceae bacterium]
MLYGLYLSAQGAQARSTQLDVVANNLANAGTTAFKRDLALFQAHRPFDLEHGGSNLAPGGLVGSTGGLTVAETVTDFSQGALEKTGGSLDLAIAGPGFFRVTDGTEELLTRDGRFARNAAGELVTAGGRRVLSVEGTPIRLNPDAIAVEVAPDGTLSERFPTGELSAAARLAVVLPQPPDAVEKVGDNLYRAAGGVVPVGADTRVAQGFLEGSGVNPVTETMRMIEASRAFETNVNMMKFQDESLARLLTAARP